MLLRTAAVSNYLCRQVWIDQWIVSSASLENRPSKPLAENALCDARGHGHGLVPDCSAAIPPPQAPLATAPSSPSTAPRAYCQPSTWRPCSRFRGPITDQTSARTCCIAARCRQHAWRANAACRLLPRRRCPLTRAAAWKARSTRRSRLRRRWCTRSAEGDRCCWHNAEPGNRRPSCGCCVGG